MTVELYGLIADLVAQAGAVADAALRSLYDLDAAGASNGMDPGPLAAGTASALAAGAAAAAGGGTGAGAGGGGSSTGRGAGSSRPAPPGERPPRTTEDAMRDLGSTLPELERTVDEDQREHWEDWEENHGTDRSIRG